MGKQYYEKLGVSAKSSPSEIKAAYKKAAYKWHPDRNPPEGKDVADRKFKEIAEAYEVLSDPQRRAAYDRYGDEMMGHFPEGSAYPDFNFNDPNDIFRRFFANAGSGFPRAPFNFQSTGRPQPADVPLKDPPKILSLKCTLSELFTGCRKQWKATKQVTDTNNRTMQLEKLLQIDIQPGWREGTRVTFEGEGDEGPDRLPGDYVFVVEEIPHPRFVRDGDDLTYRHALSLSQALSGFDLELEHLDGRRLTIPIQDVVTPTYEKVIRGEGMPGKHGRGDLRLQFDVDFPTRLRTKAEVAFLRE